MTRLLNLKLIFILASLSLVLVTVLNTPLLGIKLSYEQQQQKQQEQILISPQQKTNVTLSGLFVDKFVLPSESSDSRWYKLLQPALNELNRRHPDMNIQINYTNYAYDDSRTKLLDTLYARNESIDIISLDQIWLAEFADKGLLKNVTNEFLGWHGAVDLYPEIVNGCIYNNSVYAVWTWSNIRGIWYWKDMLQEAGVDPNSLKTWDGYLEAADQLDEYYAERDHNVIQGVHLVNASWDVDMWYPYLWMLGGDIVELRAGHPDYNLTKGVYWFPTYNSSFAGVKALEFLKDQIDAGIEPIGAPNFESAFVNKNFSVMLAGNWLAGDFVPSLESPELESKLGFIPYFPTPDNETKSTTIIGGWELAIPASSMHADLAWELITIMNEPSILRPVLAEFDYLPTQRSFAEGPNSGSLRESIPYYEDIVAIIPYANTRPNIVEYPEIAQDIHEAIQQIYSGEATPKEALDAAAAKSAARLGW